MRNTNYERSVQHRIIRKLGYDESVYAEDTVQLDCSTGNQASIRQIKLFGQGERCEMPEDSNYLAVVSEMDGCGVWVPSHTFTARSRTELTGLIRQLIVSANGVVIEGSQQFEPLMFAMGLRHIKSEWANL
ncbi:MAG: hypothetical protein QM813_21915 [Verrucomicrobiota bacterium]